jgi:hypothetical protein
MSFDTSTLSVRHHGRGVLGAMLIFFGKQEMSRR